MLNIKKQTDWYNEQARLLQEKNGEMTAIIIAPIIADLCYTISLLECLVAQQNFIINKHNGL